MRVKGSTGGTTSGGRMSDQYGESGAVGARGEEIAAQLVERVLRVCPNACVWYNVMMPRGQGPKHYKNNMDIMVVVGDGPVLHVDVKALAFGSYWKLFGSGVHAGKFHGPRCKKKGCQVPVDKRLQSEDAFYRGRTTMCRWAKSCKSLSGKGMEMSIDRIGRLISDAGVRVAHQGRYLIINPAKLSMKSKQYAPSTKGSIACDFYRGPNGVRALNATQFEAMLAKMVRKHGAKEANPRLIQALDSLVVQPNRRSQQEDDFDDDMFAL